jgi:hypothetical protein
MLELGIVVLAKRVMAVNRRQLALSVSRRVIELRTRVNEMKWERYPCGDPRMPVFMHHKKGWVGYNIEEDEEMCALLDKYPALLSGHQFPNPIGIARRGVAELLAEFLGSR